MALSQVEIYNMALGLAGNRARLSAPDENRREAELCQQFYPQVVSQVQSAAFWSCLKDTAPLAQLAFNDFADDWTSADPMPPWAYAYGVPSNILRPRFLQYFERFELGRYGASNALMTNSENALLVYSKKETNTALWDEYMTSAVYYALAGMIVRPLSGSSTRFSELLQTANQNILMARENEANLDSTTYESIPDWLTARGISGPTALNPYIYPVGPLFVGS